ncbi:MAG TPA: hypothetical protein VMJ10_09820 [Kofleriaceae bacterium]|nr:hypothetical protein [Kofleriaceae bacterium]
MIQSRRVLLLLAVARIASAQPAPDKVDAKALMQTGVKLFDSHDYLGALAIFREGYQRFPSAKFLLNIGTALKELGRKAEAANAYERYLGSSDTDPAKRDEVIGVLSELDKDLGKIALTITPHDAWIQVGDEWVPADQLHFLHAEPGSVTVRARHDGYQPGEQTVVVAVGQAPAVTIALALVPTKPLIVTVHDDIPALEQAEGPRSRYGGFVMAHVSVAPKFGSAWLLGGTADLTEQLAIDAAFILGPGIVSNGMTGYPAPPPKFGGYVGASFSFLSGQMRPRVSAGMPVFASDGARFSLRAAGGVEYVANRHISITAELGVEENLNPPGDIRKAAFVPALAAIGRL